MKTIYLAADHAGFPAKEALKKELESKGYSVVDCGATSLNLEDDYPDFIRIASEKLSKDPEGVSFLFGGSGQGEAMAANRMHGVRAAVYYGGPDEIVTLSRAHNNANALSLGARFVNTDEVIRVALLWLGTAFSGDERHKRRIGKIDQ